MNISSIIYSIYIKGGGGESAAILAFEKLTTAAGVVLGNEGYFARIRLNLFGVSQSSRIVHSFI